MADGEPHEGVNVADAEDDLMSLIGDTLKHKTDTYDVEETAKTGTQIEKTAITDTHDLELIANNDNPSSTSESSTLQLYAVQKGIACDNVNDSINALPTTRTSNDENPNVASVSVQDEATCPASQQFTDVQNGLSVLEPDSSNALQKRIEQLEESLLSEKSLRAESEANCAEVRSKLSTAIAERDSYIAQARQLKEDHAVFAANGKAHYEKKLQDAANHLNQVVKQAKDRDQAARNAIEKLRQESSQKIADAQQKLEVAVREKDLMVVRYAEGETKVIKVENEKEKLAKSLADIVKDKDVLLNKVKTMRDEKLKMQQITDAKQTEAVNTQKEVDRLTENLRQSETKTRWLQGKMATESEGVGEMKLKVDRLTNALKDAREDAEKSKKHFENVIREYQKKEDEKETDSSAREQEKEVKRIIDEQLIQDKVQAEMGLKTELELAEKKNAEMAAGANSVKTRLKRVEEEKLELVSQLNELHQDMVGKKNTIGQLSGELKSVQGKLEDSEKRVQANKEEMTRAGRRVEEIEATMQSMKEAYEESHVEVDNYSARNAELLSFTEKVSSKNTQLLSEMTSVKAKLTELEEEKEQMIRVKKTAEEEAIGLREQLKSLEAKYGQMKEDMDKDITAKSEMLSALQQQLDDEKNEIKVMKKKHAMAIKELSREIQGSAAKRFFEGSHGSGAGSDTAATLNNGSRAGSMTSLDNIPGANAPHRGRIASNASQRSSQQNQQQPDQNFYHMNGNAHSAAVSVDGYHGDHHQGMHEPGMVGGYNSYPEIAVVDIDKQKLVEKIVKLQKAHARKNEKMELMEEQIKALLVDVGRKDRVIQHYALKEETGSISTEQSDNIKMQLSKKGGSAMGSVFSAHHDGTMTLDLSLEINRKLQALLEDTLLKNMTLKENMETLGEEIANLSRANRELSMELQIYKKISGNGF